MLDEEGPQRRNTYWRGRWCLLEMAFNFSCIALQTLLMNSTVMTLETMPGYLMVRLNSTLKHLQLQKTKQFFFIITCKHLYYCCFIVGKWPQSGCSFTSDCMTAPSEVFMLHILGRSQTHKNKLVCHIKKLLASKRCQNHTLWHHKWLTYKMNVKSFTIFLNTSIKRSCEGSAVSVLEFNYTLTTLWK